MSKILKGMIAGLVVASMLGASPAYALFGTRVVRRVAMAAKTGTGVADKTADEEVNSKINSNLEYLKESHRLDSTTHQEKS